MHTDRGTLHAPGSDPIALKIHLLGPGYFFAACHGTASRLSHAFLFWLQVYLSVSFAVVYVLVMGCMGCLGSRQLGEGIMVTCDGHSLSHVDLSGTVHTQIWAK